MLPDRGVVVMSQGGAATHTHWKSFLLVCVYVCVYINGLYKFGLHQKSIFLMKDFRALGADFIIQIFFQKLPYPIG